MMVKPALRVPLVAEGPPVRWALQDQKGLLVILARPERQAARALTVHGDLMEKMEKWVQQDQPVQPESQGREESRDPRD